MFLSPARTGCALLWLGLSPLLHAEAESIASPLIVVGEKEEFVAAPRLESPAQQMTITRERIDGINSLNVEDSLRYAPNLIVRKRYIGDANATLSLRGSHTTQTPHALVSVDGFTISNFLGASFDTAPKWSLVAPGDVERVDIVYGPMSARYSGHTIGGAVLLKTREIAQNATRASAQVFQSHYDYYATDVTLDGWSVDASRDWAFEQGGLSLAYRHFESEGQPQQWRRVEADSPFADQAIVDRGLGFPLRIASEDSVVENSEDQFRLRGRWALGNGWQARGLAGLVLNADDTTQPRSFLRDDSGAETFVGITGVNLGLRERRELLVGLGLQGELLGWSTDIAVSRFDILKDLERTSDNFDPETGARPLSGLVTDAANTAWTHADAVIERRFGTHGIAMGLSYAGYGFKTQTDSTEDWLRASNPTFRDASGGDTTLLGLFVEDQWGFAPKWTVTAGLRAEHWRAENGFLRTVEDHVRYPSREESALSPKLAVAYRPTQDWTVTAAAALATRFPTVRELYQPGLIAFGPNVGDLDLNGFDPDLAPEDATDFQLVLRRDFGSSFASLTVFRQALEDAIFQQSLLIPNPNDPQGEAVQQSLTTNIGEVRTDGIEVWIGLREFGLNGVSLDANVALLDAEITDNPLSPELVGNRFPRVPDVRANAVLRYQPNSDWDVAIGWRYQDTPDRNIENTANSVCQTFFCVSRFSIVDLKLTRRFEAVALSVGVDNLNDERAFVFHPYPGRTFVAELRWEGGN
ncbi:TonB-dependent receptor [Algiphilus sp.]|uniref:TonB-dependent receptor n=1 Tax=Algiphilus sp. TaxID=1872431 RepID=UPI002A5D5E31|nr:TonB-dependent receptor [Pseudomonadota bacterium]